MTHKAAVLEVLSDGQWHKTTEFINARCGSEGMRRLRELAEIFSIEKRKAEGSAQWEYRINLDHRGEFVKARIRGSLFAGAV